MSGIPEQNPLHRVRVLEAPGNLDSSSRARRGHPNACRPAWPGDAFGWLAGWLAGLFRKGVLELPLRISSDSPAAPPALNSWVRLGEGRPAGQCYGGAPWESFGGMIIGCPDSSGRFSKSFFSTVTENTNHLQIKSGPTRPLQPHYPHAGCRGVREEVVKKNDHDKSPRVIWPTNMGWCAPLLPPVQLRVQAPSPKSRMKNFEPPLPTRPLHPTARAPMRPCWAPRAVRRIRHIIVRNVHQDFLSRKRVSSRCGSILGRLLPEPATRPTHSGLPRDPPTPVHVPGGSRRENLGRSRRECGRSAWFSPSHPLPPP